VHRRKEIENFLLVPEALQRAADHKIRDRSRRSGKAMEFSANLRQILDEITANLKSYVQAQSLASRRRFERGNSPALDETTVTEAGIRDFENRWLHLDSRLEIVPGKDVLAAVNSKLQEEYRVSITPTGIIDAMTDDEIPGEMRDLVQYIADLSGRI
jgi:hypothetical protein